MMNQFKIALYPDEPPRSVTLHRLEELLEFNYFSQLEFADWEVEQWVRNKCTWAYKKGVIGQLALWLGKLHGGQIERGEVADVTIRWIHPQIGYGVQTNRKLKQWEYIGEYTGLLRRRSLLCPNLNDYCFMYPREWISLKAFTIDSEKQGNITRFINHSNTPNCESVSVYQGGVFHVIFRTIQEIPAGEWLTYDYGDIYWVRRKKFPEEPLASLIAPEDFEKLQALS
jgi:hypothetical protein